MRDEQVDVDAQSSPRVIHETGMSDASSLIPHPSSLHTRPPPREMLDPRVRTVWRLNAVLTGAFLLAVAVGAALGLWLWDVPLLLALLPVALALTWMVLDVLFVPDVRYRHWRWALGEEEIDLQHGLVTITRRLIPMARVQHVDTRRGLLDRRYGLAAVIVYTAAGSSELPGLAAGVAAALRDRIAALANTRDDL